MQGEWCVSKPLCFLSALISPLWSRTLHAKPSVFVCMCVKYLCIAVVRCASGMLRWWTPACLPLPLVLILSTLSHLYILHSATPWCSSTLTPFSPLWTPSCGHFVSLRQSGRAMLFKIYVKLIFSPTAGNQTVQTSWCRLRKIQNEIVLKHFVLELQF